VLEDFTIPGSQLSVDFFLPTLGYVIEVQGSQHKKHSDFFHGEKTKLKFAGQMKRDNQKAQWAEQNGFTFIEIVQKDDIDGIRRLRR
jgi:very-short-patch-repair endonuclease